MANESENSGLNAAFNRSNGNLNNQIRVVGAGNTAITFGAANNLVILCDQIQDNPPSLTQNNPATIQGIGDQRPVAIIPSSTQGAGTLTLRFWEKYPSEAEGYVFWQQVLKRSGFNELDRIYSIASLMGYQRTNPNFSQEFRVRMFMENPVITSTGARTSSGFIVKEFMGPVITNVSGDETVDNSRLVKTGTMTIMYTHVVWQGRDPDLSVVSVR